MPSGGANIKPVSHHKSKGNYRPGRHAKREKELDTSQVGGIGEPPEHLTPSARVVWREVLSAHESTGVVCALDRLLLSELCTAVAMQRKQPLVGRMTQIRLMLVELGMTPASRARLGSKLGAEEKDEPSEMQKLLGGQDVH